MTIQFSGQKTGVKAMTRLHLLLWQAPSPQNPARVQGIEARYTAAPF
ncbi:hypothetical protein FHW68_003872 [Pseudomonas sp. Tn43]|nr:hypothetical protein [Pseudomonas sp. Tn43]